MTTDRRNRIAASLIKTPTRFVNSLGPGILFAATSVGVSHLVQSTRAGAAFGLGLLLVIVIAHMIKYSAFSAGADYAAATGKSLLFAYQQQGKWSLVLYAMVTLGSMFIVLAAVTLVASGLFKVVLGVSASISIVATAIVFLSIFLLIYGKYQWLEKMTKWLIALLAIITVITTIIAVPKMDWTYSAMWFPPSWDLKTILFVTALVGWMPTALDTSVWQSLWTVEKARQSGPVSFLQSRRDFIIGFVTTLVLAICFLLIGASIMHGSGKTFSGTASGFAAQFIDIYAQTLGEWSRLLIGVAALAVMLSTVLAVLDGYPRASAKCILMLCNFNQTDSKKSNNDELEQRWYVAVIIVLGVCALSIIYFWLSSFKLMIDIAATISFVTAPVLAILNHRAMSNIHIAEQYRLKGFAFTVSALSIVCLTLFSVGYVYLLFA